MKIYHNPRCRKSRETLALIKGAGKEVEIVEYLKNIPNRDEILDLLSKLGLKPEQLLRKGEAAYKENVRGENLSEDQIIDLMIEFPKLIERPIVVNGLKAVIGRPPENALALL